MLGQEPSEQSSKPTGTWTTGKQQSGCSHTGSSCWQSGGTLILSLSPTTLAAQHSAGTHQCQTLKCAWTLAVRASMAIDQQHNSMHTPAAQAATAATGAQVQQRLQLFMASC